MGRSMVRSCEPRLKAASWSLACAVKKKVASASWHFAGIHHAVGVKVQELFDEHGLAVGQAGDVQRHTPRIVAGDRTRDDGQSQRWIDGMEAEAVFSVESHEARRRR